MEGKWVRTDSDLEWPHWYHDTVTSSWHTASSLNSLMHPTCSFFLPSILSNVVCLCASSTLCHQRLFENVLVTFTWNMRAFLKAQNIKKKNKMPNDINLHVWFYTFDDKETASNRLVCIIHNNSQRVSLSLYSPWRFAFIAHHLIQ